MSDTTRGIAILLSVLLWSPIAPALLRGDMTAEKALLLYCGALLLSLTGCALLSGLVHAYTADHVEPNEAPAGHEEDAPVADPDAPRRRIEDEVGVSTGT